MSAALQTISDFPAATLLDQLSNADPTSADLRARAAFWRRYLETTPGLAVDQIARLEASCVALDERAERMDNPPAVVTLAPVPAVARKVATRKSAAPATAKATKLTAEQFWALQSQAVSAIRNVYGERWHVLASHADTVCLTVPTRLCSMTGPLGGKIKWRADWRMPAAKYWPGGALPDCGLIVAPGVPETRRTDGILEWVALVRAEQALANAEAKRLAKAKKLEAKECDLAFRPDSPPMVREGSEWRCY